MAKHTFATNRVVPRYRYEFVKNIKQPYLSVLMPYFYSVLVYM